MSFPPVTSNVTELPKVCLHLYLFTFWHNATCCWQIYHRFAPLDGTFPKEKFVQTLLLAVGIDVNSCDTLHAWVVVENQRTSPWTWFIKNIHTCSREIITVIDQEIRQWLLVIEISVYLILITALVLMLLVLTIAYIWTETWCRKAITDILDCFGTWCIQKLKHNTSLQLPTFMNCWFLLPITRQALIAECG